MDFKIVIAFLFAGNFLILMLLTAYRKKHTDEAIRFHFLAQLTMLLSYPFGLARLYLPSDAFAILNTLPLMSSCYFESLALLALSDALDQRLKKALKAFLLVGIVLYCASVFAFKDAYLRILVMSLVNIVLIFPPAVRVLRVKDGSALRTLMGILFLLMMTAFVVRIVDAIRLGPALVVFGPTLGEIVTLAALYVYLILGGVGIILLAKEKTDARLIRLAYYDSSTGTLNRDGFIDAMTTAIEKSSYNNEAFAMLLVDIDGLNEINESNGYVAGDRIIADTVEKLTRAVGEKGFIGRLSGDEFMVFLKGVGRQGLDDFSAALRASVLENPCDGIAYTISIGGGAYEYPAGRDIQFPMVHAVCADALKAAKKRGYDTTVIALT